MFKKEIIRLYRFKRLRPIILTLLRKNEGGDFYSDTLRQIFMNYHQIEVGAYSYGCFCPDRINPFTRIGRYCSFAAGVCIFNGNHPLNHLSLHPFFYNPKLGYVEDEKITRRWIEIGHDVWVGRNALIMPSVKSIGNGAVIGAGAVVTKDVPDFAVVAGNPAKIIKYRFDSETINDINLSQWWLSDIKDLLHNTDKFSHPFCRQAHLPFIK